MYKKLEDKINVMYKATEFGFLVKSKNNFIEKGRDIQIKTVLQGTVHIKIDFFVEL